MNIIAKNTTAKGSANIHAVIDVIQPVRAVINDVTVDVIRVISGGVGDSNRTKLTKLNIFPPFLFI